MSDFLDEIKEFSSALKKAAKWSNSNRTIDFVEEGTSDYIFEFYCYIRMLADLKSKYQILFVEGKTHKDKFPEKPGFKKNFPRFHLLDRESKKVLFQLCAGTMIESDFEDQHLHPDISLQDANSPDNPNKNNVLLIWDAKHIGNSEKRIPNKEIREFATIAEIYELNIKPHPSIDFGLLKILKGNCLITNGDSHHESNNDTFLKKKNIRLIYNFDKTNSEKSIG